MQRYITPGTVMRNRFRHRPAPAWRLAILCFRDYTGSQILVEAFGATPVGYKVLYGMEEFDGAPIVYEAELAGGKVGIVTRCNWGGPQAAILVEELAELGVEWIIGYGAAGSIDKRIAKGKQLIASRTLLSDGTSRAYRKDEPYLECDAGFLRTALEAVEANGLTGDVRETTAATIDALYRETKELVEELRSAGAEIVNMETSALYAVSRVCGIKSVWIGFVSDCLVDDDWDDWHVNLSELAATTSRICLEVARRTLDQ
ncbi:hypothetical protein FE784_35730 [Paenibacillus hemerocallicola]|uniref:Uridine phosphorylase n=1 Tax=Paenibacillus hemerocallicola TaxID=1172614 RepID=A0A5C4SXA0_9BACL|nr:hypothetical protein [Paenibacillus hemerocallicola]TNJ60629.1 hypothetical protein FE784_35730 [Paenibacillus hemerocallicola]